MNLTLFFFQYDQIITSSLQLMPILITFEGRSIPTGTLNVPTLSYFPTFQLSTHKADILASAAPANNE